MTIRDLLHAYDATQGRKLRELLRSYHATQGRALRDLLRYRKLRAALATYEEG